MNPQIHPLADAQSPHIGATTRVWQFVVVLPSARIGADCNICSHVLIENDVIIGDRVTLKSGVQIWDSTRIEDDVFIGPNVSFANDPFPRSKQYHAQLATTTVKVGASVGGGNHFAGYYHWPWRHGGGGCRGHQVRTGLRGGGRQPGAYRALFGCRP